MTTWFTSDPHWGHRLVAQHRGFESVEAHDDWLFDVYDSFFAPDDIVWWLGDLAMSQHLSAASTCIATEMEAKHHLVFGNHDPGHPMHRDAPKARDFYTEFESAQPYARRRLNRDGQRREVMLSHFPYTGGRGEDRYPQYRLPDFGKALIHGHTHSTERVSYTKHGTLQVHVGIDAWRRPVRLEEVADLVFANGRTA